MKPIQIAPSSNTPSDEWLFGGFPWISAIICYSVSWGYLLVRPNTLYWDDWQVVPQRSSTYMSQLRNDMGQPPWSSWFESFFVPNQLSFLRLITFILFFCTGLFFFEILKKTPFRNLNQIRLLTLIFLITPVHHARISLILFDYTTSLFLFFGAWLVVVKAKRALTFLLSLALFFVSLKTHSLLFFLVLPVLHLLFLSFQQRTNKSWQLILQSASVAMLVPAYLLLRQVFWMPLERYEEYNTPALISAFRGMVLFVPSIALSFLITQKLSKNYFVSNTLKALTLGLFTFAVAIFPYVLSDNVNRYIFSYNIGWQSRHLMLTNLGISFIVVGLSQIISKNKMFLAKIFIASSVSLNLFIGLQYVTQSIQQNEVVELLESNRINEPISEFADETPRFKGRGATYAEFEWFGLLRKSGYEYPYRVAYKFNCKAAPEGVRLTLKSDVTFLQGLRTRQLGTYFEITPCSKVLATEN